jgi:hypothetical protein
MPKPKTKDDPKAQKERFEKAVQERVDAGELDPIEAETLLSAIVSGSRVGGDNEENKGRTSS